MWGIGFIIYQQAQVVISHAPAITQSSSKKWEPPDAGLLKLNVDASLVEGVEGVGTRGNYSR